MSLKLPPGRAVRCPVYLLLAAATLLAACGEEPKTAPPTIRAVKTITVQPQAAVQVRRISGLVQAVNVTPLSFEVSGNVTSVQVKVGEKVTKGEVLAALDTRQYQLNLESVEAELRRTKAALVDKTSTYQAKKTLYEKKVESKTAYERAKADYEAAVEGVRQAESKVSLAKRDLNNTKLRAPFDGVIAKRDVEPAQVVSAGKVVLEIQGNGDMEVAVNVPDTMVNLLKRGQKTAVTFPTLPNLKVEGRIDEIASRGGEGNTFPVTVRLLNPSPELRAGMSAEVRFRLGVAGLKTAFAVPVSALVPSQSKAREAHVYVFDKTTSTLKKTKVEVAAVRGNDVLIGSGLTAGQVVVTAGVAFLHDGLKVKLLAQRSSTGG
ncbi:MAG: efflux RND transporter periplasmic adaptor subunit [Alphaproteobacteria bacterium]|nr:efflux RND transporter periplasmic adaptor subunit [Alphaproteobacteria bacterium]